MVLMEKIMIHSDILMDNIQISLTFSTELFSAGIGLEQQKGKL